MVSLPPSTIEVTVYEGLLEGEAALTFSLHAHGQTLLVAAVLAAVALSLVDHAVLGVPAGVGEVLPNGPLKEALAALAAVDSIVFTWWRG